MSAEFSTHAANFVDALNTGTDPRTGQFFFNMPLVTSNSGHLLGPQLALSLSYSSLSHTNLFGLGHGVALQGISVYTPAASRISLRTGDSWFVEPNGHIPHRKLKDCTFTPDERGNGWTLRWKSGETEHLSPVGDGHYVTSTLINPLGKCLYFDWAGAGQSLRLQAVRDSPRQESVLCRFDWPEGGGARLTVWPGRTEAYHLDIALENDYLTSITREIADSEPLSWRLEYDDARPSRVTHATGMADVIQYQPDVLPCPGGGSLAVVSKHTRYYNHGQPETIRFYQADDYAGNNFLGNNANVDTFGAWNQDRDYLSNMLDEGYLYTSTESLVLAGNELTTSRQYNNYHLQISERIAQGNCTSHISTKHHAKNNVDIDSQPYFYQFPQNQTILLNDQPTEQTATTFDDYGNPLTVAHPDGTLETHVWFDAKGEPGLCPTEPNGFTRFIKQEAITPPVINGHQLPSRVVRYTYENLGKTSCVVQKSRTEYSEEHGKLTRLSSQQTHYVTDNASPEFGRITKVVHTQYDPANDKSGYTFTQTFTTEADSTAGLLTQTVVSETFDGLKRTHTRELSMLSGRTQKDTDAHGIVTEYAYDNLGRIVCEVDAAHTPYAATQRWRYVLSKLGDEIVAPVTIHTREYAQKSPNSGDSRASLNMNKLWFMERTRYDGAGRVVARDIYDIDQAESDRVAAHEAMSGSAKNVGGSSEAYWRNILLRQYDAIGRVVSETHSDWTTGDRQDNKGAGQPSIKATTTIKYDGWGNRKEVHHPEGTITYIETDPVHLTQKIYMQNGGATPVRNGWVLTEFDKQTWHPVKRTAYRTDGSVENAYRYEWDGLGRLRKEIDETEAAARVTQWSYDSYGRVLTQTLPNGDTVSRSYAPHLSGNYPVDLRVTPEAAVAWCPAQAFDGFGRRVLTNIGGRLTRRHYDATRASPVPERITLPSHKEISRTYIPELGFAPKSVRAEGVERQVFDYAPIGTLLKATEGHTVDENHWSPSGALLAQTFTRHNQVHQAFYMHTLQGLTESYSDITGTPTHYTRDDLGRLKTLTNDTLTLQQEYDAMGRLSSRTVSQAGAEHSITATLSYDDFSREIRRTVSDSVGAQVEIRQSWSRTGQLSSRTTLRGHAAQSLSEVLKETYGYDMRNRLVEYAAHASQKDDLPLDAHGHPMSAQTFRYDALNNLTHVTTTRYDGISDTASHHYESAKDPTQLTRVTHTHRDYASLSLRYDAEGRLTLIESSDGHDHNLSYDALGRLLQAGNARYSYDAQDRLVGQHIGAESFALYYRGQTLVTEINASGQLKRLTHAGTHCVGVAQGKTVTLLATDRHGSPLWSHTQGHPDGERHQWSPWGSGKRNNNGLPGFNGERIDPASGVYHLGNGYRAYNPTLMRFHCPDSLSPFGAGGINPYTYCASDPINRIDPSGHLSGQAIFGIVAGAAGLGLALFTGGSSIAVASSILAALSTTAGATELLIGTIGVAADVTAIASGATEDKDPKLSATLGWVSMGLGLAALGAGIGWAAFKSASSYANTVTKYAGGGGRYEEVASQTASSGRRYELYNGIKREYVQSPAAKPLERGLLGGEKDNIEKVGGRGEPADPAVIIRERERIGRELRWEESDRRMNDNLRTEYQNSLRDGAREINDIPWGQRNADNPAYTRIQEMIDYHNRMIGDLDRTIDRIDRTIRDLENDLRRLGG